MKRTIDLNAFVNAFHDYGRGNQFSFRALKTIFEGLESLETEGEEYELDVVGICCDFNESTLSEWQSDYGNDETKEMNDNEKIEFLNHKTWVLGDYINEKGETVVIYQRY